MNKYLKRYNELIKELEKENDNGCSFLTRMLIAEEFDCYIGGYYENLELTEEQEEYLINVIYDYYIDTDDMNIFYATRSVVDVFVEYENFETFKKEYEDEEKYLEILDKINYLAFSH